MSDGERASMCHRERTGKKRSSSRNVPKGALSSSFYVMMRLTKIILGRVKSSLNSGTFCPSRNVRFATRPCLNNNVPPWMSSNAQPWTSSNVPLSTWVTTQQAFFHYKNGIMICLALVFIQEQPLNEFLFSDRNNNVPLWTNNNVLPSRRPSLNSSATPSRNPSVKSNTWPSMNNSAPQSMNK